MKDLPPIYAQLLQWATSNRRFVAQLQKKWHELNLSDQYLHEIHHKAFEEIDCLECARCCKTLGPRLTSSDLRSISRYLKTNEKAVMKKYVKMDEDGDLVFNQLPCPFLQSNNCCSVYDHRPRACKSYPHTHLKGQAALMHLTGKNAETCPAVARMFQMIMERKPGGRRKHR